LSPKAERLSAALSAEMVLRETRCVVAACAFRTGLVVALVGLAAATCTSPLKRSNPDAAPDVHPADLVLTPPDLAILAAPDAAGPDRTIVEPPDVAGPGADRQSSAEVPARTRLTLVPNAAPTFHTCIGQASAPATFLVTNAGAAALGPVTARITGPKTDNFVATTEGCEHLAPGDACTVSVVFTRQYSYELATLVVTGPAPDFFAIAARLYGTSPDSDPPLVLGPQSDVDFGPVPVGTTSSATTLTLTRTAGACPGAMALGPFTIIVQSSALVVADDTCSTSVLAAGEACTFGLVVQPASAGYGSAFVIAASLSSVTAAKRVSWTGIASDGGSVTPPDGAVLDAAGDSAGEAALPSACGDGVVSGAEECDDGLNRAEYGALAGCAPDCTRPPRCGDGVVQAAYGEACDFGRENAQSWEPNVTYTACMPDCQRGGYCGDGIQNGPEECDDGQNDGTPGTCNPDCTIGPSCGDRILQPEYGEECEPQGPDDPDCASTCRRPG
jgi:hypothetical protein